MPMILSQTAKCEDVNAILPNVSNITVPFYWLRIDEVMGKDSVDFDDCGLTDKNLESKRDDDDYFVLMNSIKSQGFLDPVFWDGFIYGNGHHRLAAAIDLGYTHIPATDDEEQEWRASGVETKR